MATDTETAKKLYQASIEDALATKALAVAEAARQRRRIVVCTALPADEAMASTTSSKLLWVTTGAIRITAARVLPNAALTASGSVYATCTVGWTDDAGGSATTVATLVTDVAGGSWTADQSKAMTLATDSTVATGKALKFITAKASTGTIVPLCKVEIEYEEI